MRRFFSAVLITASAALIAPATLAAAEHPATTTAHRRVVRVRVYDPYRRDYHKWSRDEDRAYRAYLSERHRRYVGYQRLRLNERRAYWHWRHEREERLEHRR